MREEERVREKRVCAIGEGIFDDNIPTDPMSDPISDSTVLPIPTGRLSIDPGAQLKNAECTIFSPNVINHILDRFLPDEFCRDPVPNAILQALESEEYADSSQEEINILCDASPVIYSPPSIISIESFIGEIQVTSLPRTGSSVVRKSHTSDDELEEFDSPLSSIMDKSFSPRFENKANDNFSSIRYQLLREVWRMDD